MTWAIVIEDLPQRIHVMFQSVSLAKGCQRRRLKCENVNAWRTTDYDQWTSGDGNKAMWAKKETINRTLTWKFVLWRVKYCIITCPTWVRCFSIYIIYSVKGLVGSCAATWSFTLSIKQIRNQFLRFWGKPYINVIGLFRKQQLIYLNSQSFCFLNINHTFERHQLKKSSPKCGT